MLAQNFNLIEGSLYRSPLRLMEEMDPELKKVWDRGYHHAVRGTGVSNFDFQGEEYKAYNAGYDSGMKSHEKIQVAPAEEGDEVWDAFDRSQPKTPWWHRVFKNDRKDFQYDMYDSIRDASGDLESSQGHKYGERLGIGGTAMVFRGGLHPDHVTKLELGNSEARLAEYVMGNEALRNNGALPNFHGVTRTEHAPRDRRMEPGQTVHAIHREDLKDVEFNDEEAWRKYVSAAGNSIGTQQFNFHTTAGRDNIGSLLDQITSEHRPNMHPEDLEQFDQFSENIKSMAQNGILPSDMSVTDNDRHLVNLGVRPSTNEVVVRDIGSYRVVRKPSGPRPQI
jgi:hypothetical protein